MAKSSEEKETTEKTKPADEKVVAANKPKIGILEYFKSPSFLVLVIFIVMMVVGGVVVYM
ncbi:MAG: hypothetical protein J5710_07100 [Treponema sp.]|nr:hypothetical protein [Treponema sp.]